MGSRLVGPHRDELRLGLGPMPAKGYASHGESWSFALALRLAAYDLLSADGGEPVLILDDVFAELDARRRGRLAELVAAGRAGAGHRRGARGRPRRAAGARFDVAAGEVRRADLTTRASDPRAAEPTEPRPAGAAPVAKGVDLARALLAQARPMPARAGAGCADRAQAARRGDRAAPQRGAPRRP